MSYIDDIESHGFAVLEDFVDDQTLDLLFQELANASIDKVKSRREGKAFAIRDLLNVLPFARTLANSSSCRSIVEPILGSAARVVRGIYFDKTRTKDWPDEFERRVAEIAAALQKPRSPLFVESF